MMNGEGLDNGWVSMAYSPSMKKKNLKKKTKSGKVTLNAKCLPAEVKLIKAKAKKYFKGNMTALFKQAAMSYKPQSRSA